MLCLLTHQVGSKKDRCSISKGHIKDLQMRKNEKEIIICYLCLNLKWLWNFQIGLIDQLHSMADAYILSQEAISGFF